MDLNFFNKVRILDGGMGQELLSKGLIHHGTLWSASALIKEENHSLVIDTHNSFIEAGANPEEITLIDGGNFNHNDCATFSVISAKLWFDTMLNGFESIGINETLKAQEKNLLYVMNILGEIVNPKTISENSILIYVYDDGSVEKKINTPSNHY